MFRRQCIVGLFLLTLKADDVQADVSKFERKIYQYFCYRHEIRWMGHTIPYCRFLCPDRYYVVYENLWIKEIVLESLGCMKFEVEILACFCGSRPPIRTYLRLEEHSYFVNGLRGEIYQLKEASGICDHRHTWTIHECVSDADDEPWGCITWVGKFMNCIQLKFGKSIT